MLQPAAPTQAHHGLGTTFNDIAAQPSLILHITHHLTRSDACALALATPCAARALKGLQLLCCPRIMIAASGSSKVVSIPLTRDGQPYRPAAAAAEHAGLTEVVVVKSVRKRKRRTLLTSAKRQGQQRTWLTGMALGPHGPQQHGALYVCDYATRGVLKFTADTFRSLGVFASGAALSEPEGITFVGSTCYVVCIGSGSIVSLGLDGRVQQVTKLSEGLVPWGLTSWDPVGMATGGADTHWSQPAAAGTAGCTSDDAAAAASTDCGIGAAAASAANAAAASTGCGTSAAAAAAAGVPGSGLTDQGGPAGGPTSLNLCQCAALFVAVDVEYETGHYTVPPEGTATGCVVAVRLSSSGVMLGEPQQYSQASIKRLSGLCFDHAGALWVTSMERLLMRFAGPSHLNPGALLQTLSLCDLLPDPVASFYPFDVLAVPVLPSDGLIAAAAAQPAPVEPAAVGAEAAAAAAAKVVASAIAADISSSSSSRCQQAALGCSTQLVVTLHRGPGQSGAVAVLKDCCPVVEQQAIATGQLKPKAEQPAPVCSAQPRLLSLIHNHPALNEVNMMAVQF